MNHCSADISSSKMARKIRRRCGQNGLRQRSSCANRKKKTKCSNGATLMWAQRPHWRNQIHRSRRAPASIHRSKISSITCNATTRTKYCVQHKRPAKFSAKSGIHQLKFSLATALCRCVCDSWNPMCTFSIFFFHFYCWPTSTPDWFNIYLSHSQFCL